MGISCRTRLGDTPRNASLTVSRPDLQPRNTRRFRRVTPVAKLTLCAGLTLCAVSRSLANAVCSQSFSGQHGVQSVIQ
jgi:hypothetical protein